MNAINEKATTILKGGLIVERTSERELVVKRNFNAPARIVFQAWTKPELFKRWWAPRSIGIPILSCDMDVRTGGTYRLEFGLDDGKTWSFFGKYLEVIPNSKLVWTNEEEQDGAVTTVTFTETDGKTQLVLRDLYASKQALDEAMESGSTGGFEEQFGQLDELLLAPAA